MRKLMGVVAVLAAVVAIPAMAVAQEAWCGGAYNAQQGSNFGPCPISQAAVHVAGQVSGIQGHTVVYPERTDHFQAD